MTRKGKGRERKRVREYLSGSEFVRSQHGAPVPPLLGDWLGDKQPPEDQLKRKKLLLDDNIPSDDDGELVFCSASYWCFV
jgi:hypothetical protein